MRTLANFIEKDLLPNVIFYTKDSVIGGTGNIEMDAGIPTARKITSVIVINV
jgi:hypothetical protein